MDFPQLLPNGIGDSTGDSLVLSKPLHTTSRVWYVHQDGDDDADGLERKQPFETLGKALAEAESGDIIVLMEGYEETLGFTLIDTPGLTIVGAGRSGGEPVAKITSDGDGITIDAGCVSLRNIHFVGSGGVSADPMVSIFGVGGEVRGCRFDCLETGLLASDANHLRITDTAFYASVEDGPSEFGVILEDAKGAVDCVTLDGVTFDGGQYGFEGGFGFVMATGTGDLDNFRADNISLIRGADMALVYDEGVVRGRVHIATATGGARVIWPMEA